MALPPKKSAAPSTPASPSRPASPSAPASKERGARPGGAKPEAFIGHASATMLTEETFEEFEARVRSGEQQRPQKGAAAQAPAPRSAATATAAKAPGAPSKAAPAKPAPAARPAGKPRDRDGVEWDYVTSEGVGFNDDDDDDAMTFTKNGKTYFKPDFGPVDPGDFVAYWTLQFALEAAMANDDEAEYAAACKQHQVRNRNHMKRITATFMKHYGEDPEFMNAAVVARQEQSRAMMRGAVKPGALDPIEGVSLQVYAGIAAQQQTVTGDAFVKLLAKHKLDEAKFARVAEAWQARMSDQSDPMAAMAVATEFGKAFAGAGVGQYGASAASASGSMGINDKVAGKSAKGAQGNLSFEKYVEVMTAQSCWAQQGQDVNAMLKKVFNMNATDWSNASAHWAQRMSSDMQLISKMGPLQAKFTQKYSAGVEDPDADLDV